MMGEDTKKRCRRHGKAGTAVAVSPFASSYAIVKVVKNVVLRTALLIFAAAGANVLLATVVGRTGAPLYFDTLFTVVATIHLGLGAGVAVAVLTNGTLALTGQILFPFVCCNILSAVITTIFRRTGHISRLSDYLWLGIALGIANGTAGSVMAYSLFSGITEVHPIDRLVSSVIATGQSIITAVFWAGMMSNMLDKVMSTVLAFLLESRFSRCARWAKKAAQPSTRLNAPA